MKTLVGIVGAVFILITALVGYNLNQPEEQSLGSVERASEYHATSTYSGMPWADILLKTGAGVLGSYVVLGADTTQFDILNATTTDVNKRTGNKATSSIIIASIPSSAAAGVYTFDSIFTDGLYIDVKTAGVGTTTLTFR